MLKNIMEETAVMLIIFGVQLIIEKLQNVLETFYRKRFDKFGPYQDFMYKEKTLCFIPV